MVRASRFDALDDAIYVLSAHALRGNSSDGRRAVTASADGRRAVTASADGRRAVTASADGRRAIVASAQSDATMTPPVDAGYVTNVRTWTFDF